MILFDKLSIRLRLLIMVGIGAIFGMILLSTSLYSLNADLRTEIETNVISLRGLTPTQAIEPILMTPEEFNALLTTDLASPTAVTDTLETYRQRQWKRHT